MVERYREEEVGRDRDGVDDWWRDRNKDYDWWRDGAHEDDRSSQLETRIIIGRER